MMENYFLNGFVDELTKEAAHPLFSQMRSRGTLLGQKVRGLMKRVAKRSRKIGKKGAKKSVKGAKKLKRKSIAAATAFKKTSMSSETLAGVVRQPKQPKPSYGTGGGAFVRTTVREAGKAKGQRTEYGTGGGNLGAKKAPPFTSDTKGGKLGNPTENPNRFGTGCGTGRVKTGGVKSLLAAALMGGGALAASEARAAKDPRGKKRILPSVRRAARSTDDQS